MRHSPLKSEVFDEVSRLSIIEISLCCFFIFCCLDFTGERIYADFDYFLYSEN